MSSRFLFAFGFNGFFAAFYGWRVLADGNLWVAVACGVCAGLAVASVLFEIIHGRSA